MALVTIILMYLPRDIAVSMRAVMSGGGAALEFPSTVMRLVMVAASGGKIQNVPRTYNLYLKKLP